MGDPDHGTDSFTYTDTDGTVKTEQVNAGRNVIAENGKMQEQATNIFRRVVVNGKEEVVLQVRNAFAGQ